MLKYDLIEYKFSKQVTEDFPKLITMALEYKKLLRPYNRYVAIKNIIDSIDESTESLMNNLSYYKTVVNKKGAKDEQS